MAKLKVGDKLPKIENAIKYRCKHWGVLEPYAQTTFDYKDYYIKAIENDHYVFSDYNFMVKIEEIDQYIKDENMKQYKNTAQNKIYRSFAILGTKSLLRAMEEELNLIGYKTGKYSFIKNTDSTINESEASVITSNMLNPNCISDITKLYCGNASDGSDCDVQFQLPQQWEECLTFCKEQLKPKIKVGDWVYVIKTCGDSTNEVGDVKRIIDIDENCIFKGCKDDIKGYKLGEIAQWEPFENIRLATKEEIEKATKIVIGKETMRVENGKAVFGCQYITKEEINTFKKFIGHPINAKVTIHNTEITTELLNKILDRL